MRRYQGKLSDTQCLIAQSRRRSLTPSPPPRIACVLSATATSSSAALKRRSLCGSVGFFSLARSGGARPHLYPPCICGALWGSFALPHCPFSPLACSEGATDRGVFPDLDVSLREVLHTALRALGERPRHFGFPFCSFSPPGSLWGSTPARRFYRTWTLRFFVPGLQPGVVIAVRLLFLSRLNVGEQTLGRSGPRSVSVLPSQS